jgi:hypothetical protein
MAKYNYFVAFISALGDGNGNVGVSRKVESIEDIRNMEKYISETKNAGTVTITNFILLGVEE